MARSGLLARRVAQDGHGGVAHLSDNSKIFLGKECDAYRPGLGTGRWYFAAAAFLVEINGDTVRFANDIPCEVPHCQYVPE